MTVHSLCDIGDPAGFDLDFTQRALDLLARRGAEWLDHVLDVMSNVQYLDSATPLAGMPERAPALTEALMRTRFGMPDAEGWVFEMRERRAASGALRLGRFIALFDSAGRILTMPELLP